MRTLSWRVSERARPKKTRGRRFNGGSLHGFFQYLSLENPSLPTLFDRARIQMYRDRHLVASGGLI